MSSADVPQNPSLSTTGAVSVGTLPRTSNYNKLLTASAAGNLADGIFKFALPVLAVGLTTNKILISAATAFLTLPWLIASLPAGAVADRADRLKTMVHANTVRTFVLAAFAIALVLEVDTIVLLLLVALALGLMEVIFDVNAQAMLPNVVSDEMLGQANARLMTFEFALNQFVGKALGGWLMGIAIWAAFGTAALAYFVAAVALLAMTGVFRAQRSAPKQPMREEISEGLKHLWHKKVLRNLALLLSIMEFFYEGVLAVLPIFALAKSHGPLHLTTTEYGFLIASMAVGGTIGAIVANRVEKRFHPIKAMIVCISTLVFQLSALTFTENAWIVGITTAMVGGGALVFTVLSVTMRQRLIPDDLRGRVNATYRLIVFGAMSVGAIVGGIIAQATSIHTFFGIALVAVIFVTATLPLLIKPYDRALAEIS